jgi:hypothetical protein
MASGTNTPTLGVTQRPKIVPGVAAVLPALGQKDTKGR